MCWSDHRYRSFEEHREREAAGPPPAQPTPAEARASDADRQRVIEQLQAHTADGRLTLDEFAARVGEAWEASTHGDLRNVLRDLPPLPDQHNERDQRRRGRHGGRRFGAGIPVLLLIAALVVAGSLLMDHFAWWLIPVGFFVFGGCGAHHERYAGERSSRRRDDDLISV